MDRGEAKERRGNEAKNCLCPLTPQKELMVTSRNVCIGHPRNVAEHSHLGGLDPAETSLNIHMTFIGGGLPDLEPPCVQLCVFLACLS